MANVSEMVRYLKSIAPLEIAAEWDNVGLLLGDPQLEVKRVMTCLTLTPSVVDEAIAKGVNFIVTHHPILFRGMKSITTSNPEGLSIWKLIQNGVSVYSAHTSFDNTRNGINDLIAARLGLKEIGPLRKATDINPFGEGRIGSLAARVPLRQFAELVRKVTKADTIQISGNPDKEVGTIAIACGAGGEFLRDASKMRAHVFLSGEVRFHECLSAIAGGMAVCMTGHYASERLGIEALAERIREQLTGVDALCSENDLDPIRTL